MCEVGYSLRVFIQLPFHPTSIDGDIYSLQSATTTKNKHHRKIEKMTTHGPNDVSPAKLRYRREHVHLDFVNLSPLTTLVFRRSQQMSTAQASWRFSLPNLSWCGLTLSPLLNVNKSFHMDMGKDYTSIELPRQPTVSIKWGKITPRCHSNDAI